MVAKNELLVLCFFTSIRNGNIYKYCTMYFYCLAMFCLSNTARFSISTVVALVIFNFFFCWFCVSNFVCADCGELSFHAFLAVVVWKGDRDADEDEVEEGI